MLGREVRPVVPWTTHSSRKLWACQHTLAGRAPQTSAKRRPRSTSRSSAMRRACRVRSAAQRINRSKIGSQGPGSTFKTSLVYIHADLHRLAGSQRGRTGEVEAPWSGKGSGYSLSIEAFIVAPVRGDSGAGRAPAMSPMVAPGGFWSVRCRRPAPKSIRRKSGGSWWTSAVPATTSASCPCSMTPISAGCFLPPRTASQDLCNLCRRSHRVR